MHDFFTDGKLYRLKQNFTSVYINNMFTTIKKDEVILLISHTLKQSYIERSMGVIIKFLYGKHICFEKIYMNDAPKYFVEVLECYPNKQYLIVDSWRGVPFGIYWCDSHQYNPEELLKYDLGFTDIPYLIDLEKLSAYTKSILDRMIAKMKLEFGINRFEDYELVNRDDFFVLMSEING